MTLWKSKDAELATGGTNTSAWEASGVSIDSRTVEQGDLFIAIVGENLDGHDFVRQALHDGAAAAVVNYVPDGIRSDAPLLIVDDTMDALWDLARFSRQRIKGKVALVTGSVGKTSTKEMLAHTLDHQGKVHYTFGNLNNHYGLPLTMTRMAADTDFAIIEVGMSSAGEISPLSVLANPDVAVVTNVAPVHLEFFDSVEEIADAKSEVFDGLKEDGVAVLNRDNAYYQRVKDAAMDKGVANIIDFGADKTAEFRLAEYKDALDGAVVLTICAGSQIEYKIGIAGEHQALNSLCCLAVVDVLGADVKKAAEAFIDIEAKEGRGKRYSVEGQFGNVTLIDDSYNASPVAVEASLKLLGNIKAVTSCRAIAVLGDMFELGENAQQMHIDVAKKILENKIDMVFTAGELMKVMYDNLPAEIRGQHAKDSQRLAPDIFACLQDGDIILVKGSRGMRMEKIINYILEEGRKKDAI